MGEGCLAETGDEGHYSNLVVKVCQFCISLRVKVGVLAKDYPEVSWEGSDICSQTADTVLYF